MKNATKFTCPVCDHEFYGSAEQHYVHFSACLEADKKVRERHRAVAEARTALFAAADEFNKKMEELEMNEKASVSIEGWVNT